MAVMASAVVGLATSGGTLTGGLTITAGGATVTGVVSGTHLQGSGAAPGMAAGANAGTSPPAPALVGGSTDCAGGATFGTGTTPAAGAMVAVTFNSSWGANPPGVVLIPSNAAAQALNLFVTSVTAAGFTVSCAVAPAASQGNSTYAFQYVVIG